MMRWNFRIGWFRIEILPRFKIVFDVRRTVNKKPRGTKTAQRQAESRMRGAIRKQKAAENKALRERNKQLRNLK